MPELGHGVVKWKLGPSPVSTLPEMLRLLVHPIRSSPHTQVVKGGAGAGLGPR